MLSKSKAFMSFSVNDLERAREFYSSVLGLTVKDSPMGILELHTEGNNPITIYPKDNHESASFTILNFPVEDIEATVDAIIAKGYKFEQYTGDLQTDEKGIARGDQGPTIAWIKDPAGNILSVMQLP